MNRRVLVCAAIASMTPALAACATMARPASATWVRMSRGETEASYTIRVGGRPVELSQLDAVALARAMSLNSGRTEEDIRRNVTIYISAESALQYATVVEVMRCLSAFQKFGIVARDAP